MSYLTSKKWWEKAGIRAVKTMAQSGVAVIGSATLIEAIDWRVVVSTIVVSGVLSILTSLGGLPEVVDDIKETFDEEEK